jgi:mRNA interferase RelE/StbE
MELIIKKSFTKELKRLPSKTQAACKDVLKILSESKSLMDAEIDIVPMEGQSKNDNYYRIRVGSYRIGIEYIEPSVVVITVLSRGNMYKHFPPK